MTIYLNEICLTLRMTYSKRPNKHPYTCITIEYKKFSIYFKIYTFTFRYMHIHNLNVCCVYTFYKKVHNITYP